MDKIAEMAEMLPRKHRIGKLVFGAIVGLLAKEMAERLYVETLMDYWAKKASK